MNLARPTAQQERWVALAARFPGLREAPELRTLTGGWRSVGLMTRVALFALGLVIAMTGGGIVWILSPGARAAVAGVLLVIGAEWLIAERRVSGAGIEEALMMAGYLSIALWLADLASDSDVALAAATAIALGAAGWRLRSPLCVTGMALALSVCAALAMDQHRALWQLREAPVATVTCYAMACAALLAGGRILQRPSSDRMLDWLVIVMPVAGYLWAASGAGAPLHLADLAQAGLARLCVPLAPLAFAAVAATAGFRRRTHGPLIAALLCIGCAAFELRELTGLSLTARLLCWGGALLLLSMALDRWLRTARRGITSQRLASAEGALDVLPVAGAALLGPQARVSGPDPYQGQGGGFGGGGASGRF